jgi:hypothetical protein
MKEAEDEIHAVRALHWPRRGGRRRVFRLVSVMSYYVINAGNADVSSLFHFRPPNVLNLPHQHQRSIVDNGSISPCQAYKNGAHPRMSGPASHSNHNDSLSLGTWKPI